MRKIYAYQLSSPLDYALWDGVFEEIFSKESMAHVYNRSVGYFDLEEDEAGLLHVLQTHVNQSFGVQMTVVITFVFNEITFEALDVAHTYLKGQIVHLVDVMIVELANHRDTCINLFDQYLKKVDRNTINIAIEFIAAGCNAHVTADRIYVHRNTVSNRLLQFYSESDMDIRDFHFARLFQFWWLMKHNNQ